VVLLGFRLFGRARVGSARRRPLGVDARARFATRRDLRPLIVAGPVPGRFPLGVCHRRLVATEDGLRGRRGSRTGDRGAVALVGPSRSGKTTAAVAGILEWEGPAVLSSVKSDLLGATLGWRQHRGEVRVYDPTGTTPGTSSARWSPLRSAATTIGAQRAARSLCDAAPRSGVEGGMDFWLAQAEIMLSGLLWVAHHAKRDMATVAEWVLSQDRPGELGPGEVKCAIDALLASTNAEVAGAAADASRSLLSIWEMEERTRASVYATAQTVVWPWADPGVARSARKPNVDLAWLLGGTNTVYLCAPIEDQQRLAPAFGGLLNDLIKQVYLHVSRTGRPLDPPLLVVIDEAGNTPLRSLPEYASTLAGLGVLLVTIWQSLAQLEAAYGRQADTVLTNHLSKLFYAGLSDPASLRYVAQVLGDAEIETRSQSSDVSGGRGSIQVSTTRAALAPAHALRQMRPGDALLLHGTLPPAHVRTRPYYKDRELARRAALA
jgi:type IV secretion system protein VirD4